MKILITGGTLDKQYNPLNGALIFNQTSVAEMLRQSRNTLKIDLDTLMLKDSLEMNDEDRQRISQACNDCDDKHIIVTHGTDTMVESAHAIATQLTPNKTVVLLGAMVPYQFKGSDALFNLGCAIAAVQLLPAGIYITMNGKVFDYREVQKNRALGEFVAI
ncbi:MAG: L-asparaginase [Oleispira sp.]|jgi:L-asparaginase